MMRRGHGRRPSFVVGLGGSAGGLEAFEQFFASTPADTGMAFVIVTHLDPAHKALLPELVQRTTAMTVRQVEDGVNLAPDAVYVIPPDRELSIEDDVLHLHAAAPRRGHRTPIDAFFRSLAGARGATAIGVVLSGMGADGAAGARAIADAGGAVAVQDPATAGFAAMPEAAIAAVRTAVVAPPELLPARIAALAAGTWQAPAPGTATAIAHILELVRRRTGRDLSLYKPSAIERRLERRLAVVRLADLDAYATYLAANPDEAELLFRELLIGVTHFFRDPAAFEVLRDQALPALLALRAAPRTLRAWIAGCSTGEEAYSLAIVVHELLTAAKLTDVTVQIYATDIDDGAITVARAGSYAPDLAEHVSAERLARFFTREEHGYRVRKEIRERVVFAQHDLISDPPFTRLDLVCCRNVLIYLQPVLQQKLLTQFHYALAPDTLLVLGSSESVSATPDLFVPVDAKAKVFRRLGGVRGEGARMLPRQSVRLDVAAARPSPVPVELSMVEAARRLIVDSVAPPAVVINERGDLLYASRRTGRYLEPAVGKTNVNIFAMAREGLGPQLGVAVRQAVSRRRQVNRAGLEVRGERGTYLVDLSVLPMDEPASLRGLFLVVFAEAPAPAKPPARSPAGRSTTGTRKVSQTLERELARTKVHLQTMAREMEAAQSQVEAANEELQSTNEELQSTNEELTTSKEELQSLNEELMSLNAELVAKNDDLATANDDLRNLLNSTRFPTLFLDNSLRVKRFTSEATRVANLIPADVGRAITDLTLRVDYPGLARDVEEVLETLVFKEVQVTGDDGASYTVRIHPYRTMDNVIDGVVITFSDVTALRRAEEALNARTHDGVVASLLDRWPGMVWVRDLGLGRDVYLNDRARERLRTLGSGNQPFESLLHPDDAGGAAAWQQRLDALRDGQVISREVRLRGAGGGFERFHARESVLARTSAGATVRVLAVFDDPA